jgi:hypothetical protein
MVIQPIDEWFGTTTPVKPKREVYTREQRRKAKEKAEAEILHFEEVTLSPDEEWFRHYNWREKREKVRQALLDAGTNTAGMERFALCGAGCQVEYNKAEQRYRLCGSYCHSRHCEPCMKAKSALIISNLRKRLDGAKQGHYHFITLTLAHDKTVALEDMLARLNASYKKLRNTDEWKYGQVNADRIHAAMQRGMKHSKAVKEMKPKGQLGGAATIEVKWSAKSGWHAHLHIISEGTAITNHRLKDLWYEITGDSWECDCRQISADKDVAYYVGKYVTKGTNNEVWDNPTAAAAWVKGIKGARMCATFGTWRGFKLLEKTKEEPGAWIHIASLNSLVRQAKDGKEWAMILLLDLSDTCMYDPHRKRTPKPK